MRLEITKDVALDCVRYVVEVTGHDIQRLELDRMDRLLMDECENSSKASDKLLMLEMIFRRTEQQREVQP